MGTDRDKDAGQGENFVPGNPFLTSEDRNKVDVTNGGKYVVAERTAGRSGSKRLRVAAEEAAEGGIGCWGSTDSGRPGGHLPFQTADGQYDPPIGRGKEAEEYTPDDLFGNPTLADMTRAALTVLEKDPDGFWLMVEPGDVDWANHDNNLDNSIGASTAATRR